MISSTLVTTQSKSNALKTAIIITYTPQSKIPCTFGYTDGLFMPKYVPPTLIHGFSSVIKIVFF